MYWSIGLSDGCSERSFEKIKEARVLPISKEKKMTRSPCAKKMSLRDKGDCLYVHFGQGIAVSYVCFIILSPFQNIRCFSFVK
jgi:hypothetical protein